MLNTIVLTLDKPHFEVRPPAGFSPTGQGFIALPSARFRGQVRLRTESCRSKPGVLLLGDAPSGVQP
jgi:hypothetical protein